MKANFFSNAKRAFVGSNDYDDRDLIDDSEEYGDEEEYEEVKRKSPKDFFAFLSGRAASEYDEEEEEEEILERPYRQTREHSFGKDYYSRENNSREYSSASARQAAPSGNIKYNPASADTEIVIVSLTNFDDSEKIVREVKSGKTAIFDVSEIQSTEDARRVVDYISGAAAGMECPFSKMFTGIFCIAPKNVKLTAKRSKYM